LPQLISYLSKKAYFGLIIAVFCTYPFCIPVSLINNMSNTTQPRIIVVGSSNTDLVVECDNLPKHGETVFGDGPFYNQGGKGANQAMAAVSAGAKVNFIGACGDDEFGAKAKETLYKAGIDLQHFITKPDAQSGMAVILLGGKEKENVIAVTRSANNRLSKKDIYAAKNIFTGASAVLCQLEIPLEAVEAAAKIAHENNIPFILNPAPARQLPNRLLGLVHTLIPNEHEAAVIADEDIHRAAKKLCELGCANTVVTMGSKGALLVNEAGERHFKATAVNVVNTVGAGDTFAAYYTVGIAEGMDIQSAVKRAVKAASLSVTRQGAQSAPLLSEVA